jgi:di/tricarboxylate transporter
MTWEAWLSIGVALASVAAMTVTSAAPDLVLVAAATLLVLTGVLEIEEAFEGFANPAVLTVAALFVVAQGLRETGALDWIARRVLGTPKTVASALVRLMVPATAMSAFLNNTPIVALMIPIVQDWSKRTKISPSKLMIPLSYATVLGGTCSLIGTSTNLVVSGMASDRYQVGMFEISILGIPVAVAGVVCFVLGSRWLLPQRTDRKTAFENVREYTVAMTIEPGSPVVGQTIEDAGLRHLPGLFLVEIEREGQSLVAVAPDEKLSAGDVLVFAGVVESVVDLRKIRGLVPAADRGKVVASMRRRLVEAVVGARSELAGKNVREARFRTRYGAAIIAVHRRGERVESKVGDIVLSPGDVLLLEAPPSFLANHRHDPAFALVSEVEGSEPPRHDRAFVSLLVLGAMIVLNAIELLPLLTSALLAAGAMIVTRCLTVAEARRSLELPVLVAIAASFAVGTGLEKSGAAEAIGTGIVSFAGAFGNVGVLAAIYVATAVLTNLITNNAAAALMFPVAVESGDAAGVPIAAVLAVLMMGASASFATPIGYQTNLMVWGPGGYRFSDFVRAGLPLQIVAGVVTIAVASWFWS